VDNGLLVIAKSAIHRRETTMAIARRFKISHHEVFPHGAYIVAPVAPVLDFDQSTRELKVQQVDKDTGELIWSIDVLDANPEAPRKSKTVSIKILGKVQPVPPSNESSSPFTPVEFDGLTALAYIDDNGNRPRIAWSFRAAGMHAPGKAGSTRAAGSAESRAA